MARPTTIVWPYVAVFVAVVVSFCAAVAIAQRTATRAHAAAVEIALNVAPSMEALARARTSARVLHNKVSACVDSPREPQACPKEDVQRNKRELQLLVEDAVALGAVPGERWMLAEVERQVALVIASVDGVMEALEKGDVERASVLNALVLPQQIERASLAMLASIRTNAERAQTLAEEIGAVYERSQRITMGLMGMASVFTVVAAALLFRMLRRNARQTEDRADELERFAARLAHDVRNPLATALMALGLAGRRHREDEELQQTLQYGKERLEQVEQMLDALFNFARSGARPDPDAEASVVGVVDAVVKHLQVSAREHGVAINVEPITPDLMVACGPGLLMCVIENLVQNAIKHMGEREQRRVALRALEQDACVRLEVEDTGPGVPTGMEDVLFDAYVKGPDASGSGLGLGLATVRRIANAHGGSVGVRPARPQGSVFFVVLPRRTASVEVSHRALRIA